MRIKDLKAVVKGDQHIIISDSLGDVLYMGSVKDLADAVPEYVLELWVLWIIPLHNDTHGNTLGVQI